eukprot:scaffold102515_cov63-Attheya_sp.AAC.6
MIRCQVKLSNGESVAQQVGNLSIEALEDEMQIRVHGARHESHTNSSAKMLLDGIDTSCKAMTHTNQASKSARRQMFSMWYSICSPGIFLTVSPCDETNFRLRLYIGRAEYIVPDAEMSDDNCMADFKLRCRQQTTYPGASAFDFSAILNIVVSDILGWDKEKGCSTDEGGAFGKIDAFSGAVEEQGRKTLHVHMLLNIKELSQLLEGLQEVHPRTNRRRHTELKRALKAYVNSVMSTHLHRSLTQCNISFKHDCTTRSNPPPQAVSPDILRANRHKRGTLSQLGLLQFEILIMRHMYKYFECSDKKDKENSEFLINAFFNLHHIKHAKACFKYGVECCYNLPTLAKPKSCVNVHEDAKVWYDVMGQQQTHHPITIDLKREVTDVFMNTYNQAASIALGSNPNVNTGEIRTVFYCTTYSSKNTQEDDKELFQRVINSFVRCTTNKRRELEAAHEAGNEE